MNIELLFTGQSCTDEIVKGKNAVVIDVLRAASVITEALQNGAECVVPFKTTEEALKYCKTGGGRKILCGERNCEKIEGFDLGNSPIHFDFDTVYGREIVLTTTNGTTAIQNASLADAVYILCYFNINVVRDRLLADEKDAVFVCAGTEGRFSLDDALCAGMCISGINSRADVLLDDASLMMMEFFEKGRGSIRSRLKDTKHFKNLLSRHYGDDLEYCLKRDIYNIVPCYKNNRIMIYGKG